LLRTFARRQLAARGVRNREKSNLRIANVVSVVLAMGCASGAHAIPWTEVGDAGELTATAQITMGSGALTSISGSIPSTSATDADMYRIHISVPGDFSATTVGTVGTPGLQLQNSELFLFNAAGLGVYGRDDNAGTARTTLPAGNSLGPQTAGDYFLVITGFNRDPVSAAGLVFPDSPNATLFGPTGPGGSLAISGYTGLETALASRGNYSVNLTGAEFVSAAAIPEPGTVVLLGISFVLVMLRRRDLFHSAKK
jgi:hypothetical protein